MWPFNKIHNIMSGDRARLKNIQLIIFKISGLPLDEAVRMCDSVLADSSYFNCTAVNGRIQPPAPDEVGPLISELFGRFSSIKSPWIDIGVDWIKPSPYNKDFIDIGLDHSDRAFVKRGADPIFLVPEGYQIPEPSFRSVYHMILEDYFTSPEVMERGLTI